MAKVVRWCRLSRLRAGLVALRQAITRQLHGSPPHRATLPAMIEGGARSSLKQAERI